MQTQYLKTSFCTTLFTVCVGFPKVLHDSLVLCRPVFWLRNSPERPRGVVRGLPRSFAVLRLGLYNPRAGHDRRDGFISPGEMTMMFPNHWRFHQLEIGDGFFLLKIIWRLQQIRHVRIWEGFKLPLLLGKKEPTSLHQQQTLGAWQPPNPEGDASVVQSCYRPWHSSVSSARCGDGGQKVGITTESPCVSFLHTRRYVSNVYQDMEGGKPHHFCCDDIQWIYGVFFCITPFMSKLNKGSRIDHQNIPTNPVGILQTNGFIPWSHVTSCNHIPTPSTPSPPPGDPKHGSSSSDRHHRNGRRRGRGRRRDPLRGLHSGQTEATLQTNFTDPADLQVTIQSRCRPHTCGDLCVQTIGKGNQSKNKATRTTKLPFRGGKRGFLLGGLGLEKVISVCQHLR